MGAMGGMCAPTVGFMHSFLMSFAHRQERKGWVENQKKKMSNSVTILSLMLWVITMVFGFVCALVYCCSSLVEVGSSFWIGWSAVGAEL
jgi:hypothetical protein